MYPHKQLHTYAHASCLKTINYVTLQPFSNQRPLSPGKHAENSRKSYVEKPKTTRCRPTVYGCQPDPKNFVNLKLKTTSFAA